MGLKNTQAAEKAGIKRNTGHNIWARAGQLEVDHSEEGRPPPTIEELVAVKPKTGRPKVLSESDCNEIYAACTASKKARRKQQHHVALEEGFEACRRTIETRMRAMNLRRCKPTKKLGLTDIQRAQRYEIALSRKDWGYAEWSKVVFSDEASILVGEHRGLQNLSRTPDERYHPDVIERRYNNYSEAMFWGCFSYDYKGPCHIYYKETEEQKIFYEEKMQQNNDEEIEAEMRAEFDRIQAEKEEEWRLKGKKKPGKPASWEVFWKNHKQKRNGKYKGGIDNMRYTYECIIPLLIPFIEEINIQIHNPDEYECDIPRFIFQQDNAPSHASQWTIRELKKAKIPILEHVGNSPDMTAIESAWMPIRITITQDWNRPHTIEWTERAWRAEWVNLHQDKIRAWICRMAVVNQLVIEHEGGNEFHA